LALDGKVVVVVSGGNIAQEMLARMIAPATD
jgi:hypothetical protein